MFVPLMDRKVSTDDDGLTTEFKAGPAGYFTDFSGYPTGTGTPTGWETFGSNAIEAVQIADSVDPEVVGGKVLVLNPGDFSPEFGIKWLDPGTHQHGTILAKVRVQGTINANRRLLGPGMRMTGSAADSSDVNALGAGLFNGSGGTVLFTGYQVNNGGEGTINETSPGDDVTGVVDPSAWYWIKFDLDSENGSDLYAFKMKVWQVGDPEPASWNFDTRNATETFPTAVGYPGLLVIPTNANDSDTVFLVDQVTFTSPDFGDEEGTVITVPYSVPVDGSEGQLTATNCETGEVYTTDRPADDQIQVLGQDVTGEDVCIGIAPAFKYVLNTIFYREREGQIDDRGVLKLRYVDVRYHETTSLKVTVESTGRADRTYTVSESTPTDGVLRVPIRAENTEVTITIENDTAGQAALSYIEWEGWKVQRSTRINRGISR